MDTERDYVLGTHNSEIERLGLQHRLWRQRVLDCWLRAQVRAGSRVADIGAGPGFATLDLAELVGANGRVYAVERSARFVSYLRATMQERRIGNITTVEADLEAGELPFHDLDAAWCRWVLCFLRRPEAVIARMARSLRSGGWAIFHEYVNYRSWRAAPPLASLDQFVAAVIGSWQDEGGEPDIGLHLPVMLARAGLTIVSADPLSYFVGPEDPLWAWPAAYIKTGPARLVELGKMTPDEAERLRIDFMEFGAKSDARVLTPTVLEVLAVKK